MVDTANNRVAWYKRPWSLRSVVNKEMREWESRNTVLRKFKYSVLDREFFFSANHPIIYTLYIATLSMLWIIGGGLIPTSFFGVELQNWENNGQNDYFSWLWTIQATLTGLVYPIVISFVGLLLQRKPSSKTTLNIYLIHSGAFTAGMSSLALILMMGAQFLVIRKYNDLYLFPAVLVDSIWFFVNIILMARFLYLTIEFIRPANQFNIMRKYAVKVTLIDQVRSLLPSHFLYTAQQSGWLSGAEVEGSNAPSVYMMSRLSIRDAKHEFKKVIKSDSILSNVLFWPLEAGIVSWLRSANRAMPETKSPANNTTQESTFETHFPLIPATTYSGSVVVARAEQDPGFNPLQKILFDLAFRLSKRPKSAESPTTEEILAEIESEARGFLLRREFGEFETTYDQLIDLHCTLLNACTLRAKDGQRGSYSLLVSSNSFFNRGLYQEWCNVYRGLMDSAISLLPDELGPFKRLCYLSAHLNDEWTNHSPLEIQSYHFHLPILLAYRLGNWWVRKAEEQGLLEHDYDHGVKLRAPLAGAYEGTMRAFVEGWERTQESLSFSELEKKFNWSEAKNLCSLFQNHIDASVRMLLEATARGDRIAAEWFADILVKWWGQLDLNSSQELWILHDTELFISASLFDLAWEDVVTTLNLDEKYIGELKPQQIQFALLRIAIRNYWHDAQLVTIEILLSWAMRSPNSPTDNSLVVYLVRGFLNGKRWRGGGHAQDTLTNFSAAQYLSAKARQYSSDELRGAGYLGRLNQIVERAKDLFREEMVSGRIYSWSGIDDVASLQSSQLILLIYFSAHHWSIGESLKTKIILWVAKGIRAIDPLRTAVNDLIQALDKNEDAERILAIVTRLLDNDPHLDITQRRQTLRKSLGETADYISEVLNKTVAEAKISDIRLKEIENAAAKNTFSAATGYFPLQLFSSVAIVSELLDPWSIILKSQKKGEFTETNFAQRSSNENTWFQKLTADAVARRILWDILDTCKSRRAVADSPEKYWTLLKAESRKLRKRGLTPILILDNSTRPRWIWNWFHSFADAERQRPADLVINTATEISDNRHSYVGSLNDILVYHGAIPAGSSLLMARETFDQVLFRDYGEGRHVKASVHESDENGLLVDLHLTIERRVKRRFSEVLWIAYSETED